MRWPLYPAQAVLFLVALWLTLRGYAKRRPGWQQNLIIVPWLLAGAGFSLYLTLQAAALGWHDIPALASNAFWSNLIGAGVAAPASVILVMLARSWKRG